MSQTLSIIIPVHDEMTTLEEIVDRVLAAPLPAGFGRQVIIVDDASTDGTERLFPRLRQKGAIIIQQPARRGKGAAVRAGIAAATGDFLVVQDADLAYDPRDFQLLLQPLLDDEADVVFGSRFLSDRTRRVLHFWHALANSIVTALSNACTNLNLTDMQTCYKMMRRSVVEQIRLRENRSGLEAELTAKIAKLRLRVFEVGVTYRGTRLQHSNRMGFSDLFAALRSMVQYSFFMRSEDVGRSTLERLETYGGYAKLIMEQLSPYLGQRVLEFGSGIGSLARLNTHRERLILTDVTASYLPELHREFGRLDHVRIELMDMTKPMLELRGERIDTIYSSNVLEHIEDDLAALRGAYELLEPGGRLVILVPALMQLYSKMDERLEHFRRYTRRDLSEKLRTAGFHVEETWYINMVGAIGWWAAGRFFRQSEISDLNVVMHKIIEPISRLVDNLAGRERAFGLSVIAVARKPR
jgi:glycosyltransferase involved in cell wall biosynthesis